MTSTFFRLIPVLLPAICIAASSSDGQMLVPSGSVLRSQLTETVRMTSGAAVSAVLTEPLYVGETLAFPRGTVVKGHIAFVEALPFSSRTRRLLKGDLTPPRRPRVTLDQLVLADGTIIPIRTDSVVGVNGVGNAIYATDKRRPGLREVLAEATRPLTEPKKLQRLSRTAIKALPYHPEYLERGVVFDTPLLAALTTSVPAQPTNSERSAGAGLLHVRLLTALDSSSDSGDTSVSAVVSRPYYAAGGVLLFPAGTTLDGSVSHASPSGRWKRHGTLLFNFRSASVPGRETTPLNASIAGIEASNAHSFSIDEAGTITTRTSRIDQALAVISLARPAVTAADPGSNKEAFARAGQGRNLGLIGSGVAQASSSTATGIGFFGAALKVYDAFLANGVEIELPKHTPVLLRVHQ